METALVVDLPGRSRQLIYFRLAFCMLTFVLGLLVLQFLQLEITPASLIMICSAVGGGNLLSLVLIRVCQLDGPSLTWMNAALVGLDIAAVTAFVHLTRGIESDLFFLYLLPILLASHIFERSGVFVAALGASIVYPILLIWENWSIFSYLFRDTGEGLTAAYAHRTYLQIATRSGILFGLALLWAAFCDRMSRMAKDSLLRLGEQLQANTKLLEDVRSRAQREQLTNSISLALRGTLDLDQVLSTACTRLAEAVNNRRCIFVTRVKTDETSFAVWDSADLSGQPLPPVSQAVKEFLFAHDWKREESATETQFKKFIISDAPFQKRDFDSVRTELQQAGIATILIRPIMYGAQVRGVLAIFIYGSPELWTHSELELVDSVGGQLALAVEHAQLVEQLSDYNRDLVQKNENLDAKNLELREVQSHLIHQEKMASLGRMVAGIAHELNNPINFVHGNLPYLKEYCEQLTELVDIVDKDTEKQHADFAKRMKEVNYEFLVTDLNNILADITEGTERVRGIIRNLRSFSRLDEAELKEASLQEGIESTLKILSRYYANDKTPVESHFCTLPPVLCYPGKLNQVWMNLLSNAAQAVATSPAPLVVIRTELEDDYVSVSIADNGTGIKDVDQSKIFEPFFTTKPVGQGTGLGLSICHSIIERHGGTIRFESKVGKGTTFIVRIPLRASIDLAEEARIQAVAE